jgi:RNA polymerase sigma-70 factor (ECF subfamily)
VSAFQSVYETSFDALYRYVLARVRNRADADDIVSDVWSRVFRRYGALQDREELRRLAFTSARNGVIDWSRRQKPVSLVHDVLAPDETSPEIQDIDRVLEDLDPDEQELITFKYFSCLSFREIGVILHLNERTVQSRLYAILAKMRVALQEEDHDGRTQLV